MGERGFERGQLRNTIRVTEANLCAELFGTDLVCRHGEVGSLPCGSSEQGSVFGEISECDLSDSCGVDLTCAVHHGDRSHARRVDGNVG